MSIFPSESLPGRRVLVVEDEALIADDLERTLIRLGYSVPAVVADGSGAIESADSFRPSLVLMDIKLRGPLDGIDAARAIRERFETPVVFLTSHSDAATLSRASAVRPSGYLMKPFVERDLRVAVELALHKDEVERALRDRERWFATTLSSIGDAVIATDGDLRISFLNHAAEATTGWTLAEAQGRHIDEVLHLSAGAHPASRALESGEVFHLPAAVHLVRKDGTQLLIDDSAAPILDSLGRVLGAVVVFRDATERLELQARLTRSERLASLGTLAAGLCHEINNPLASVMMNLEVAFDAVAAAEADAAGPRASRHTAALRESLDDARDGALRIRNVVADMRAFAQPSPSSATTIALADVVDGAIKLVLPIVRQHASITRHVEAVPDVSGDAMRLSQVFVNLLMNAAQANLPGAAALHQIRVRVRPERGGAVVEIEDDGAGIPADVLPRIFDPFFTTKAPRGGMGLGLSICSGIIAAFDGEITVQSVVGVGSTFRVWLPASTVAAPTRAATPLLEQTLRGRVLIVDDEPIVTRALGRVLLMHDVAACSSGSAALARLLAGDDFDVILCDISMPDMTGDALFDAIVRERPALASRFVFMTGSTMNDVLKTFLDRALRPVWWKPFTDVRDLRSRVAEQVRLARGDAVAHDDDGETT